MILQAPGQVPPRDLFLLDAAARPGAVLVLAAAQEGLGGQLPFCPVKAFGELETPPDGTGEPG